MFDLVRKYASGKIHTNEHGFVLVVVLVMLLLGSLIIAPALHYMSTGVRAGTVYEKKAGRFYAADSGIEDALWRAKTDRLPSGYNKYAYYDYNPSYQWGYSLSEDVNTFPTDITVENVWIPKDIPAPSPSNAQDIIETGQLVITGMPSGASEFLIKISYYYELDSGEPDYDPTGGNLDVDLIGIWLPPGFSYDGNCSLDGEIFYTEPEITSYASGEAVVWDFTSDPALADFPGASGFPLEVSFTFGFDADTAFSIPQGAMSWIDTTGVTGLSYTWDADTKVFKIISAATDTATSKQTVIDAYTIVNEIRELGSAIAGDYFVIGNNLLTSTNDSSTRYKWRETLFKESSATIQSNDLPTGANIEAAWLYWSGWIDFHGYEPGMAVGTIIFEDDCNNFAEWDDGDVWSLNSAAFRGHYSSGGDDERYLEMSSNLDLSSYVGETVILSWDQWENGSLESGDRLYFELSADGNWPGSGLIEAFRNDIGGTPQTYSYTIPQDHLTANFKIRYYLNNFGGGGEYCFIDDVRIATSAAILSEDCTNFVAPEVDWDDGSRWSIYNGTQYRGRGGSSIADRTLTMDDSLDLSAYSGQTINISWDQRETGSLEPSDHLYFAFSGNGGSNWSSDIEAFSNDIGSSFEAFSYTIPDAYLTNDFRVRYYWDANGSSEYCYLDNITISEAAPSLEYPSDPTVENLATLVEETAKVNRVMFGTTAFNEVQLTADRWQVEENDDRSQTEGTWSYSCFKDITSLVDQFITVGDIAADGAATYTLGHVIEANTEDLSYSFDLYDPDTELATGESTGYPLATPAEEYITRYEYAYGGWSLIIIYTSPETKGHQLYLFDDFTFIGSFNTLSIPVSGFLTPEDPEGSRLSIFVGEGDNHYNGDYIEVNGTRLSDAVNPSNNVFNSYSNVLSDPMVNGIDLDTFDISDRMSPGDTTASVEVGSDVEIYNLVYLILSFRSESVTGGSVTYLIQE